MGKLNKSEFKFVKHDTIGSEPAEQDDEFLFDCFVDTGDLNVLRDPANPKRIIVGRTGAGKTALLRLLAQNEAHSKWLDPDSLALQFLSNSNVIKYLEALGVKLDLFYRLLWRHIIAVELIQLKYQIKNEEDQRSFFKKITELLFGDKRKKEALDYLVEWGQKFWKDTEYRIHEVTDKLETDIKSKLGLEDTITAGASAAEKHTLEERREIVHRAQEVVNAIQIQKLGQIIDVLASDILNESYRKFFLIIDKLDENWVEDELKYKLIRALIETIKDFQRIRSAKVVVSMRRDLLERVFRSTRDSGFQEEKYQPLFLNISWSKQQLISLIDRRINKLVQRRYTKEAVSHLDVFPKEVDKEDVSDYLLRRTLYRPRDIIQFVNSCISMAENKPEITASMIRDAEGGYSTLRFRSLGEEWFGLYPNILEFADILKRRNPRFSASEISDAEIERVSMMCYRVGSDARHDKMTELFQYFMEDRITLQDLKIQVVKIFYDAGFIGIKPSPEKKVSWSFVDPFPLKEAEIQLDARLEISPMLYRVLGINTR